MRFGCCRSNFHFAWPKFVQSLWMRKADGLAAVAYAPSCVTTDVATIRTSGAYPFGDAVALEILRAKGGAWPLFVRIPGWAKAPKVAVNGTPVKGVAAGGFVRIDRDWRAGDRVEMTFPAEIVAEKGIDNSRTLRRGPLVYAFAPKAGIKEIPQRLGFVAREYAAQEAWNKALLFSGDGAHPVSAAFVAGDAGASEDPFRHGARPCALSVTAGQTSYAGWGTYRPDLGGLFALRPIEPPPSPIPARLVSDVRQLELLPLGATQIRLACLPWFVH